MNHWVTFQMRIFSFLLLLLLSCSATFGAQEPFSFSLDGPNPTLIGEAVATLSIQVSDGFLLYRERLQIAIFGGKVESAFPEPHQKDDPFGGGQVLVYDRGTYEVGLKISGLPDAGIASLTVDYQGCSSQTCFMPAQKIFLLGTPASVAVSLSKPGLERTEGGNSPAGTEQPKEVKAGRVKTPSGMTDFDQKIREHGFLWALMLAFLGGLLVSFTPCVYPMIPITLSIIGGRDENRSAKKGFVLAMTYVAGLSLTYALLGLLVALFGAHIRSILQGALFQAVVAAIFLVLALSMFDVFMLQIPSALRQRLAGMRGTGLFGIFFMGMISGLMASPCVAAPLAGILAFIAASGSAFTGFFLLLAFSWGMGIILVVIGTFSGSLNSLPKAGEWMDRVKEFYGFLLFGAALYFAKPLLGTAEVNLAVALLLGAFAVFLGLFFPVTSETPLSQKVFKGWGILAMSVAAAFAVTAAAEWGGLSLPPMVAERAGEKASEAQWHDRFDQAMAVSGKTRQLIFVDFRADWCAICKELEHRVFPATNVRPLLDKFVLWRMDATTNSPDIQKVLQQYKIVGLPTLLVLRPDGQEIGEFRMVGDIDAESLEKNLKAALAQAGK